MDRWRSRTDVHASSRSRWRHISVRSLLMCHVGRVSSSSLCGSNRVERGEWGEYYGRQQEVGETTLPTSCNLVRRQNIQLPT